MHSKGNLLQLFGTQFKTMFVNNLLRGFWDPKTKMAFLGVAEWLLFVYNQHGFLTNMVILTNCPPKIIVARNGGDDTGEFLIAMLLQR